MRIIGEIIGLSVVFSTIAVLFGLILSYVVQIPMEKWFWPLSLSVVAMLIITALGPYFIDLINAFRKR